MLSDQAPIGSELRVAVVLAYHDGARYIEEQLASIFAQTHQNLKVFLFDDASNTPFDAHAFGVALGNRERLTVIRRPSCVGFVANFLYGLAAVEGVYDYYFFCDQDDIWMLNKVARAIKLMDCVDDPVLYCGRTELIDASGSRTLGRSPLFSLSPSFGNALVQNLGGGNTMALNHAARQLVVDASSRSVPHLPASHDWWCYQVVSGAGGIVRYDREPHVYYRQHEGNLDGAKVGMWARVKRLSELLRGDFHVLHLRNIEALSAAKYLLTDKSRAALQDFRELRQSTSVLRRLFIAWRIGLYRQTVFGNLSLLLGILINRI